MSDRDVRRRYIGVGEAFGGVYDFDHYRWKTKPKPKIVYAVMVEQKE